jgi:hypothetical protein
MWREATTQQRNGTMPSRIHCNRIWRGGQDCAGGGGGEIGESANPSSGKPSASRYPRRRLCKRSLAFPVTSTPISIPLPVAFPTDPWYSLIVCYRRKPRGPGPITGARAPWPSSFFGCLVALRLSSCFL